MKGMRNADTAGEAGKLGRGTGRRDRAYRGVARGTGEIGIGTGGHERALE